PHSETPHPADAHLLHRAPPPTAQLAPPADRAHGHPQLLLPPGTELPLYPLDSVERIAARDPHLDAVAARRHRQCSDESRLAAGPPESVLESLCAVDSDLDAPGIEAVGQGYPEAAGLGRIGRLLR